MPDFTIRADSVDVEQIMRQIRARIRDKRGVDYTEEQIRELAAVKLERFLDPTGVRSDMLEQFRNRPSLQQVDARLFHSEKPLVRFLRRVMRPLLKLQLNPSVLLVALESQAAFTQYFNAHQPLQFELLHNLVLELTRTNIEVKNLKMRLESVQSRLEFNERRARALEAVVQYKPEAAGRGRAEPRGEGRGDARGDARRDGRGEPRGQQSQGRPASLPPPHAPPPQAAPPQPAQQRPATPLAPKEPDDAEEAGTEPLGGVDPITGGESVRTRRRRRRRRRAQGGVAGEGGVMAGATGEQAAGTWGTASAVPGGGDPGERPKADTAGEADLKVGATGEQAAGTWGTASAAPGGGDPGERPRAGTAGEADLKVGDAGEQAAGTWGTASAVREGGDPGEPPKADTTGEADLGSGTTGDRDDDQNPR